MVTHGRGFKLPVEMCDAAGNLNPAAVGWSRKPLHGCNLSGRWGRKKRWNYWCITNQDMLFSLTLSHLDYLGLAFIYYLDFASGKFMEQTVTRLFGKGCDLPEGLGGLIQFEDSALRMEMRDSGNDIYLRVDSPAFGGEKLHAEFQGQPPGGTRDLECRDPVEQAFVPVHIQAELSSSNWEDSDWKSQTGNGSGQLCLS